MMLVILLSYFTTVVSAVPTPPNVLPSLGSQGATQATNQAPVPQTPAPLSPKVDQPQPGVPQQVLPPTQHYAWTPLGGSAMLIPFQLSVHGSPSDKPLSQQPLIVPSYLPLFSPPYGNEQFFRHGFPMILASPFAQTPANQSPNSVVPAETPSGAAPSGDAPQPIQQQQNPQIIYLLQQPMNAALGSLSSEELEMAAKMGQLGIYLSSAGAVQPVNQAAGHQGVAPTPSAGGPQTPGPARSAPQSNTNRVPVGLEKPAKEVLSTVQTPVEPVLQATQGSAL